MAFTSTAETRRPLLDMVVFLAMAVTAIAFAAALIYQSVLSFTPAVVAGAVLFMVMASTQFAVNRSLRGSALDDRLDQLEEALEILDGDLQRVDQVEDDVARLDLLNDKVERLTAGIGAGSDADGREVGEDLAQVDRLTADFEILHGRLDALRSDLESEARVQRDKVSEELRVLEGQIKQMGNELSTASGAIPTGAGEVYRAQTSLPPETDEIKMLADEAGAFQAAVGVDVEDLTVEFGDDVEDVTVELGSDVEDLTVELDSDVEPESGLEQEQEDEEEPFDLSVHAITREEEEETVVVLDLEEDPGPVSEKAAPETLETVREAIETERIDLYVQPAVALPERDPVYYEAFTRLRTADDESILPATVMSVAESAGLMPRIDNAMLLKSVQFVRRVGETSGIKGVFCDLSVQSLLDRESFPELVALMEENSSLSDSLFFELGQNAVRDLGADGLQAMKTLGELGFRFALDHVADLDVDFAGLRDRNFRFVKIEAQTLLHDMAESGARIPASDLKSYLKDFDLELIVEKVEDELSLIRLMDFGVELAQGDLFAEPERVGPELYRKLQGIDAS